MSVARPTDSVRRSSCKYSATGGAHAAERAKSKADLPYREARPHAMVRHFRNVPGAAAAVAKYRTDTVVVHGTPYSYRCRECAGTQLRKTDGRLRYAGDTWIHMQTLQHLRRVPGDRQLVDAACDAPSAPEPAPADNTSGVFVDGTPQDITKWPAHQSNGTTALGTHTVVPAMIPGAHEAADEYFGTSQSTWRCEFCAGADTRLAQTQGRLRDRVDAWRHMQSAAHLQLVPEHGRVVRVLCGAWRANRPPPSARPGVQKPRVVRAPPKQAPHDCRLMDAQYRAFVEESLQHDRRLRVRGGWQVTVEELVELFIAWWCADLGVEVTLRQRTRVEVTLQAYLRRAATGVVVKRSRT